MDDEAATAIGDVFTSFSERFASFREDVSHQLARQNRNIERQLARQGEDLECQLDALTEEFSRMSTVSSVRIVIQVNGRMVIHSGATIPADVLGAESFVDQVRSVFCDGSGRTGRAWSGSRRGARGGRAAPW